MNHRPEDLVTLFESLFRHSFGTVLVRGDDEPVYLPDGGPDNCARVVFAHGYFSSALHEISHWCIAGAQRRRQVDYGYWYCPDGRTAAQQAEFEQVEIRPQALEWLFSIACRHRFHISVDNLNGGGTDDPQRFRDAVRRQAVHYLTAGLPPRAEIFLKALIDFYGCADYFDQLASETLGEPCVFRSLRPDSMSGRDYPAPAPESGQHI